MNLYCLSLPLTPNSFISTPDRNSSSIQLLFLQISKGQILSLSLCPGCSPNPIVLSLLLDLYSIFRVNGKVFSFLTSLTVFTPRNMLHICTYSTTQLCHHTLPCITLHLFSICKSCFTIVSKIIIFFKPSILPTSCSCFTVSSHREKKGISWKLPHFSLPLHSPPSVPSH